MKFLFILFIFLGWTYSCYRWGYHDGTEDEKEEAIKKIKNKYVDKNDNVIYINDT